MKALGLRFSVSVLFALVGIFLGLFATARPLEDSTTRGIISTVFSQGFKSNRLLPALHRRSRLRMQVTAHAVTSLAGRDRRPRRTELLALKSQGTA